MNILHSTLVAAGLLACMAASSAAEIRIKELQVNKDTPSVKLTTFNHGSRWDGPYTTNLFVRSNDKSSWIMVRTFTDMAAPSGETTNEITSASCPTLMGVAKDRHWEARAVVKNPNNRRISDRAEPGHYWDHADR